MSAEIFMGTMMITVMMLCFVVVLGLFVFWVWTIVDVAKRDFKNNNERLLWLLLIILLGFVPSLVYYIVVMRPNNKGVMKEGKAEKKGKK